MTPTEIKESALKELNVIAAGEPADPDDFAVVSERYAALYDMLVGDHLTSWALTDDVPDFATWPVIQMLAYLCCVPFSISPQKTAALRITGALDLSPREGGPSLAERQLRKQLAPKYNAVPAQTEYF